MVTNFLTVCEHTGHPLVVELRHFVVSELLSLHAHRLGPHASDLVQHVLSFHFLFTLQCFRSQTSSIKFHIQRNRFRSSFATFPQSRTLLIGRPYKRRNGTAKIFVHSAYMLLEKSETFQPQFLTKKASEYFELVHAFIYRVPKKSEKKNLSPSSP